MIARATAAPARFPYAEHRTLAQVDTDPFPPSPAGRTAGVIVKDGASATSFHHPVHFQGSN